MQVKSRRGENMPQSILSIPISYPGACKREGEKEKKVREEWFARSS